MPTSNRHRYRTSLCSPQAHTWRYIRQQQVPLVLYEEGPPRRCLVYACTQCSMTLEVTGRIAEGTAPLLERLTDGEVWAWVPGHPAYPVLSLQQASPTSERRANE